MMKWYDYTFRNAWAHAIAWDDRIYSSNFDGYKNA